MSVNIVEIKTYEAPGIKVQEALRYSGCRGEVAKEVMELYESCIPEVSAACTFKVCYSRIPVCVSEKEVDFGFAKSSSKDLVKNLSDCEEVIIFGATIGIEMDRLISKYGKISPAKGLMMQAIGAERIESLCDSFNDDVKEMLVCEGKTAKPRFSPGYGDMNLAFQKDLFSILNLQKNIGLFLNDSLLMSPSKSVTAIIGIAAKKDETISASKGQDRENRAATDKNIVTKKCANCLKTDCEFRR